MTDGSNWNEWFLFPFKEKVQIYSLILLFLPVKIKIKNQCDANDAVKKNRDVG